LDYIVLSIPVFFLLIGVELLISKIAKSELYRFNDAVANISCGVTQQVTGVLFKTAMFIGYLLIYEHIRLFNVPDTWWSYVLLFIGVDFFYYWFHRYAHEISFMWGSHIVHHQSEEYNLSVALRQSAFQGFFSMIFYLPLAFLGFNPVAFVAINAFQTLYQFWIHTKTIGKLHPVFEFVFNTPSHHRVHHGRNPQYIDKNHGGTLIIFDRMFGTFEPEREEVVYGVTKPLASWNPIWANFDFYADLFQLIRKAPTWKDKWHILWNKPGWRPDSMGGPLKVPKVSTQSYEKFDTSIPAGLNYYVLAQYVGVIGLTSYFLFEIAGFGDWQIVVWSAWIFVSVGSLGGIFDLRRWSFFLEIIRLGTLPALFAFSPLATWHLWIPVSGLYLIVNLFWLLRFHSWFSRAGKLQISESK
jgi:alkylglycerol monooxygenase